MSILTIDSQSEYSFRYALREAKFAEHAIDAAMRALFPDQADEPDAPPQFIGRLVDRQPDRGWRPLPEYEPTPADLAEMSRHFDAMKSAEIPDSFTIPANANAYAGGWGNPHHERCRGRLPGPDAAF
jgi:hypothetical protein